MNVLYLLFLLILLNIRAYWLMIKDKRKAIKQTYRIPEKTLWATAWCFGSLGIYLGMLPPVWHKKSKTLFKYGVPLILLLQGGLLFYFYPKMQSTLGLYFDAAPLQNIGTLWSNA